MIFLPAGLVLLIVGHLFLMRRQGISGPVRPRAGSPSAFFPSQAARDVTMVLLVVTVLAAYAWHGAPPLEGPADPTDATYIPRPEWYFLGLFQLLKYFPGKWEVVGAMVVPGLAAGFLALLPWLDRGPDRDPRQRRVIVSAVAIGLASVIALTTLGWRDRPLSAASRDTWTLREIGGRVFAQRLNCTRCHSETGLADPLEGGTVHTRTGVDRRAHRGSGNDRAGDARTAGDNSRTRGGCGSRLRASGGARSLSRLVSNG